jgi:SagB-type dehydrogenase family enzyme
MNVRVNSPRRPRSTPRQWIESALRAGWPPLAALYRYGSADVPTSPRDTIEAFEASVVRRSRTNPPPSPFKATKGRGTLLPTRTYSGEFLRILLSRRTWRGFGKRAITPEELGSLLDLTFGFQLSGEAHGGRILFKTSPSAGARHPIEAYVLALRVAGLARGLYHYSPRTGRLHTVRRGATPALAVKYLAGQSWYRNANVLVLMTAVLPRVWWRYPHPRAYRTTLLDAGHLCQTFCLVATWLGLAPFSTMAFDDARIEKDLRLDGAREVLLYAAGVGSRPADGRWVQWPGYRPKV